MTKSQIKAELRRSACYDEFPADKLDDDVYEKALGKRAGFRTPDGNNGLDDNPFSLSKDDQRTFFLLVAEAL